MASDNCARTAVECDEARAAVLSLRDAMKAYPVHVDDPATANYDKALADTESYEQYR